MKKLILFLFTIYIWVSCATEKLERIEFQLETDTFNPVLNPSEKGDLKVLGIYSDGSKKELNLEKITLSVKTLRASGNVTVACLENRKIIPKEGGLAEINAVYQEENKTYTATQKIVVRPYYREYHQTLVLKLFMSIDGELTEPEETPTLKNQEDFSRICTFKEALEVIRKLDNITRGIPKIIYLVGWQRGGHDHLYPDWSIVNPNLKRKEDTDALESLRWLIREARAYNTTVSLHINMVDAFEESPLWDEYVKKDIIGRDKNGKLISPWEFVKGHKAYHISYTREWEENLTKRRIDNLIEMIPELKEGHTIHVDAFIAYWEPEKRPLSPWHAKAENGGMNMYKEVETQRKIFRYWREKGFDVTGEGIFWAHPPGEGFIGLQPMSWWYPSDIDFQMQIPERLSARGRTHRQGQGDFRFGSSTQGEDLFLKDKEDLSPFLTEFCTMPLPWYYLSRLDRVAFIDEVIYYSEGVVARTEDGKNIIRKGDFILRENDDLFVPALWNEMEIIAFSKEGYTEKTWKMPEEWKEVKSVDIYRIIQEGVKPKLQNYRLENGQIRLSLDREEAVSILPAGNPI